MGPKSYKKGRSEVKGRSLGRPKPFRTSGKTVLIVCEDEKSSPDYFERFRKELRLSDRTIDVRGKECGSDPMSVVNYAKEKKKSVKNSTTLDGYDYIFCVVDVDEHTNLGDAIQTTRDNELDIIISNPCFEYWYILHFEKTGSSYNSRPKLNKRLSDHLRYKYEKSGCDFFEVVYPKTKTAIKNSKNILRSQWQYEDDPKKRNPSTHVHQVVECIMDIAAKSRLRRGK